MRRSKSVTACVRALLLSLLMTLGLASAAQAQDLTTLGSPVETLAVAEEPAHVLIFTETTQFRHTEAINQGTPLIRAALEERGITSEHADDSDGFFTDEALARFDALVMFQASGDPWSAEEKAAMERYQRAGGGIAAIHNAADMRGGYAWWDALIGSQMPGHAATGTSPGLPAEVIVEDRTHPSTSHLDSRWARSDEWYNFSTNVRGDAHVLATMDETTYDPGGNRMGYDHPIAWCKPYDGGRAWITAMGHFGAHYLEPAFMEHIVGGIEYAAGVVPGDCGGTKWDQFEKVTLDDDTSAPFALDVAPDGRVFYTELVRGQVRVYDPVTETVKTALEIDVYAGGEDGMLGIAVDPNFAQNGYLYVYHSREFPGIPNTDPDSWVSQVSRWTVDADSNIDPASEEVIIEVPARREDRLPNGNIDEPGHTGGGLDFDNDGNLLLGVGDDVNPHTEPSGGYAPLSERAGTFHDARETSANTNDLRGKLLRVTPNRTPGEGGYTVPAGNLFPESEDTQDKTLPEIYAMGFRNPFRFSVDPETGWIGLADYAPDNGSNAPDTRGPAGIVEWNLIKSPGNYGWPLCIGNQQPYRDVDYTTSPVTVGPFFDCANPVNDSVRNTGLTQLPPSRAPEMYYGYQTSSVPAVIPAGGGLAPMGGPFYDYDPDLQSDVKFPEYYDGKPFFYEWAKNRLYTMILDDEGSLEKIHRFLPTESFLSPQDMKFGPDGALYTLEWGGGFGRDNPNSGIHRVDYINGSRSPIARGTATPDNGQEPLTVTFDGTGSSDPEGATITYAWDFQDDGVVDSTLAQGQFTYTTPGVYTARLTVTDPAGKTGTATFPITVGNTKPTVTFDTPPEGGFFDFGDRISWQVTVNDPEEEVDYSRLIVQPALGHDDHAHPAQQFTGRTGSVVTDLGGGHSEDMKVFFALDARYTDSGDGDVPALTGSDTIVLQPKHKEAEHYDEASGALSQAPAAGDPEGGAAALTGLGDGEWAAYSPVNLTGIDALAFRVASTQAGGAIEVRRDGPTGELLGTAAVPATGSTQRWADVRVPMPESSETMDLYLVFTGGTNFRLNFWEAVGKGISPVARPDVAITSPTEGEALDPGDNQLTATATDAENPITKVEFFVDGEKVGEDTTAPYSVNWNETTEDYYTVHAVATNGAGLTSTSRRVQFTIGEIGVRPPWATYDSTPKPANPPAEFDQLGGNFTIKAAGADLWQATNHYGAVYLPGGATGNFEATVKVASFDATHNSAKAGIIVRNDVTAHNTSPGYLVLSEEGEGNAEFMHDAGGNGQVNNTGEPVATACPGNNQPTWLKVLKWGTDFWVYCSKDGTNWTQVGVKTSIPSAAAVQDIGLFATSHITGTLATAQFTDWSLNLDPESPEEPEPPSDPAPSCTGVMSDEFDGALDSSRWTQVLGVPGDMPATSNGSLVMPITQGDINEAQPGPISYVGQPLPSGDWTVETEVNVTHDNEWQHVGLMQFVDNNNYVKLAFTQNQSGARFFEFQTETNGSRSWHGANTNVPTDFPRTVYMRLVKAGTALTAYQSTNGETWNQVGTAAVAKSGGTIGMVAAGDTDAANVDASFDYFRVTPDSVPEDPGFDDEFEGDALDGCRWNRIVNYNSNRLDVADGQLSIDTFNADISGAANGDIENLILQDAPEGDWTVETKMTAPLRDNWQLAGLMLYSDDDHYVKYDVVADNAPGATPVRRVELRYENGGSLTGPGAGPDPAPPASPTDTWWLRLTKTGNTYTGAISADGQTWQQTPGSVTVALADPAIGLMAIGPEQSAGPVTVDFDYIRVVEEEENTAPAISSAGANPTVGFGGPVEFSAAATDADGDDLTYSWDFGDDETGTGASPTHTYAEPGTYSAVVTVSDGVASDTETVRVQVLPGADEGARFRTLVFSKTAGFRHSSIDEGIAAIRALGEAHDFQVDATEDASAFRAEVLDAYDTVVFLSTTGDVLNATQQAAFEDYIQGGGGYAGIHAAADTEYDWAWYGELVGAYFKSHPAIQPATVDVEDREHPSTAHLPAEWVRTDEWYDYRSNPRENVHVLASLDESTYTGHAMDGDDHPIAWCHRYDGGRSWYTGGGHTEASFTSEPAFMQHILGGLETTAGVTPSATCGVEEPGDPDAPTVTGFADPATGSAPLQVRFSATGLDPQGGRITYHWDFGDGSEAYARAARHTYAQPGTYEAVVTATDEDGKTGTDTVEVVVSEGDGTPAVTASADVTEGQAPLRVRFEAEGVDADGPAGQLVYEWSFGDGGSAFGRRAAHRYMEPGTYDATVTVTDADGNTATDTVQITVANPPGNVAPSVEAAGDPTAGVAPLRVRFTSQGTDPDGDRLEYAWDFGDDSEGADRRNAVHTYTEPGTYTATVTVTDGDGATGTASVDVVVSAPANRAPTVQAAADPSSGTAPLRVRFTAAGRDEDGDRLSYVWDFGNGVRAGGERAVHTYTQPGTYTARVTVTDADGATGSATATVTVAARQAASPPPATAAPEGDRAGSSESSAAPIGLAKRITVARLVRRGLRYKVACEAACRVSSELRVSRKLARRAGLVRSGRLGRAAARTVRAGSSRTIVVRLSKQVRRQLRASGLARLRATVITTVRSGGETQRTKRRLTLSR